MMTDQVFGVRRQRIKGLLACLACCLELEDIGQTHASVTADHAEGQIAPVHPQNDHRS